MVASSFLRGKFRVLTPDGAIATKAVDSKRQISTVEYQEMKKHDQQNSRYDHPETSKDGETHRHPNIRILLNKRQRQKEKDQMHREKDYWRYQEMHDRRRIQEEMIITGIVLSFNIARMKA